VRPKGLDKFKNSLHRVSNPRSSGLERSALTTTLPRAPTITGRVTRGTEMTIHSQRSCLEGKLESANNVIVLPNSLSGTRHLDSAARHYDLLHLTTRLALALHELLLKRHSVPTSRDSNCNTTFLPAQIRLNFSQSISKNK
jgi:hypothetical protein